MGLIVGLVLGIALVVAIKKYVLTSDNSINNENSIGSGSEGSKPAPTDNKK